MYKLINVGAASGGEAFLLLGGRKTALIDSGYSFSAPKMCENIQAVLGDKPLDYVLLTHSHFDHASGSAMCHQVWSDVKVVSGVRAAKIFEKPSAAATMKEMNISAAKMCGVEFDDTVPTKLWSDITVSEGDVIDLEGLSLHVLEVPGHTLDCLSFWCPDESLLIGNETFGVPNDGEAAVMPCYIVGYEMAVESIKKAAALDAQHYLVPHFGELHGQDVTDFFKNALYWAQEVKNRVIAGYQMGKSVEELAQDFKALFYTPKQASMQSEPAFMTNVRHKIPMILKECPECRQR